MIIKSILESDFHYLLENFNNDKHYNGHNDVYSDFEITINMEHVNDKEECKDKLNSDFFHRFEYQRMGELRDCSNERHLVGHVVHIGEFVKDLRRHSEENAGKKKYFDSFDLSKVEEELESGNITNEIFDGMDGYQIRYYQMWCFLNENSALLGGYNPDDLPFKLALYNIDEGERFLFLEIEKPPRVNAHKPTFFDAGFGEYWRPGGYTYPIGRCAGQKGLEEIMIEKLHFEDIRSKRLLVITN